MLAGRYATEDMKKDVNDLFDVVNEAGNKRSKATYFISLAFELVQRYTDMEAVKNQFEHELAVLEITDQAEQKLEMRKVIEEYAIGRQVAEKVLSLLTKYKKRDLLIILDSIERFIRKLGN